MSSSAKNVVVEDQGFRKASDCHVTIANGKSTAATPTGWQDPVTKGASHAQAMRNEVPLTWVQDTDVAISRAPCPCDGEVLNLGLQKEGKTNLWGFALLEINSYLSKKKKR